MRTPALALTLLTVAALAGCGGGASHKATQTQTLSPLDACFAGWNSPANASARGSLPAAPVIAVVRRLPQGRGCDVEVYANEGGVLAAWSYVARGGRYRAIVSGMPSLVKTIFTGAVAARVGADGRLTHAPRGALEPVRLRSVSAVAAGCMIRWNDSAGNVSGLQLAAELASNGTLRAAVGADSSGRCLVVLGQLAAGAAIVFEASHGAMQKSFGAFFPAGGGQAIPLAALDRSMKTWNATAHVDGCISPLADPGAPCPVTKN